MYSNKAIDGERWGTKAGSHNGIYLESGPRGQKSQREEGGVLEYAGICLGHRSIGNISLPLVSGWTRMEANSTELHLQDG